MKQPLKIAFFGHDACESTVIKRAHAFAENGADVVAVMFKRERKPGQRRVPCDLIDLGETVDRNYVRRIPKLIGAIGRVFAQRRRLKSQDIFYARNIDMLFIAWMSKVIARSNAALVYEVLDVQRVFLKEGLAGKVFRSAERFLLKRSALLVVSSPRFVTEYFTPVQSFAGQTYLLENKICPHQLPDAFDFKTPKRDAAPPWKIGWFGTLRCRRSLEMLSEIAKRLGPKVEIELRGRPSREDLTEAEIEAQCAKFKNMTYFGPFLSPQDLPEIYGRVHFAWGFDYLDAGSNSDWLLPNRVYEGGAFATVCLSDARTMTGQHITACHLGKAFGEPVLDNIVAFLETLTPDDYTAMTASVSKKERSAFIDYEDTAELIQRFESLAAHTK
ncbi:MAG: glucosyl transferase [Pseudomonadota bacterium]